MKVEVKWSDYRYKEPTPLSAMCMSDLILIQEAKKDSNELYKNWSEKFENEVVPYRDTVLHNVSNFIFMTTLLEGKNRDGALKVLNTYVGQYGFFHLEGKWICNHRKALAFYETKRMAEVSERPLQPVYGGSYE